MQKLKKVIAFIMFFIISSFHVTVFADDDFDEEFDFTQFDEFLQTVNGEVNKIPNINSRHAVIYDRTTRQSSIWKKRE